MKLRITSIFFLIFIVVVISIIITLNIFFQENYQAEMASQFNRQQLIIAKTVGRSIEDTINHIREEADSLANLLGIRGLESKGLKEFINFSLKELSGKVRVYLTITDIHNRPVYFNKTYEGSLKADLRDIAAFKSTGNKSAMVSDDQYVTYFKRIINKKGQTSGYLLLRLSVDGITYKFLRPIKSGKRGYAWMMDSGGTLIYHPTMPEMIGRNIFEADRSCFKCHRSFKTEHQILSTPDVGFSNYITPYGEDKLIAFYRLKQKTPDWIVCVSIPYSEVIESIKKSMRFHSFLVLSTFLATVIISLIVVAINRERVKAEERAKYTEKIKRHAEELEELVVERTIELTTEKEKLHALISSINAAICIFDENNRLIWHNRVLEEWVSSEKLDGLDLSFFVSNNDLYGHVCSAVVDNHHIQEVSRLDFGRKRGYFQISATPLRTPDGHCNLLLLIQDITELKRAEEQLIQSEKIAALARLSAGVAHEIGNPLTSISSYVQILKEMKFDDFTKDALNTISKHINRIAHIIRQMSSFSKTKADDIREHIVKELIESTIELVKFDRRTKNIDITLEIPETIPYIYADGNQLIQVFINLILNAADAMEEGGSLQIRAWTENNQVCIAFKDSGPGIPEEIRDRVFEPFFTTKDRGTGLGLAVSYSIMQSFGGKIELESKPQEGTTFTVRLPAYEKG